MASSIDLVTGPQKSGRPATVEARLRVGSSTPASSCCTSTVYDAMKTKERRTAPRHGPNSGRSSVATRVKLRDKTGMAIAPAAQPPLLAAVMWVVFESHDRLDVHAGALLPLVRMSAAVRNSSLTGRSLRERRVGVGVVSYLLSKVVVLGTLTALKCITFTGLLYAVIGMGDYSYDLMRLAGVCT